MNKKDEILMFSFKAITENSTSKKHYFKSKKRPLDRF